jgi:hypothetical protein
MALIKLLILRRPQSGCLEGRTTLIQATVDFLTPSLRRCDRIFGSPLANQIF